MTARVIMMLKEQRRDVPEWLSRLDLPSIESLANYSFNVSDCLDRSLYYPASGFDGRPVQYIAGFLHSFIYVDYGTVRNELEDQLNRAGFAGYRLAGRKQLTEKDLAPNGWRRRVPPRFRDQLERASNMQGFMRPPFCDWLIFDRCDDRGEDHGPTRFSLVYLCADGVAAYQGLYSAQRKAPLVLAIIQPGTGFGGNYTDFRDPNGFFAATVLAEEPTPEYLICGGMGDDYFAAFWPDRYPDLVEYFHHYGGNGIWRSDQKAI